MTEPVRSAERDIVEHLLSRAPAPVDVRALSPRCGRPVPDLVRGLFRLNRDDCLVVGGEMPGSPAELAFRGLAGDLRLLVPPGAGAALVDRDGLCIAACGWDRSTAERVCAHAPASRAQAAARWWFAGGEVMLLASLPPDQGNPAWVRIARRLLRACGALSPEVC